MKSRLSATIALFAVLFVPLTWSQTTYLMESDSPGLPDPLSLRVREILGYESGYIPDALFKTELGFGILDSLQIAGSLSLVALTDQNQFRLAGFELSPKLRVFEGEREDAVELFLKYTQSVGNAVIIDYPGALPGVGSVISPRTDTGIDVLAGVTGIFSLPSGLSLLFDLNYARTELRDYYTLFSGEGYKNRIFINLVPSIHAPGSFLFGVHNRITWWFDRGVMYDVMPQLNWEVFPGFTVSVGGAAPVIGGGVWKAYAGASYDIGTENLFMVIHEGEDIRLRVYFNFLGDKADLFEPQNRQFGARNKRIMDSVVRFINTYTDYAIVVEGHTNRAKLDMSFDDEQKKEMLPLARARAAAVRDALIKHGYKADRIGTVAYGALHPLAKFEDAANCWKNRRVEILLKKKKK